jgi:hypothetical protein
LLREEREYLKSKGIDFDPTLLPATYDELHGLAHNLLLSILSEMEGQGKHFCADSEVKLSAEVVGRINRHWLFKATNEQSTRGHVDITIRSLCADEHKFSYLGEAKIWSGPAYGIEGFEQLEGYFPARLKNAFLLFYFQTKTCDDLFAAYVAKLLKDIGGKQLLSQGRTAVTEHTHRSSATVNIVHYAVHLSA